MENILQTLNAEQQDAAKTTKGALLILAGAGSGKTRVLTTRIAYMIQQGAIAGKILAVTFTNKAAREMKERLSSILGENVVKYMWVGTFHSICGRILRQDIENYQFQSGKKLDKNFTIYDETDSIAVIKQAIKKLNLDDKIYAPKLIKTVISNAKNKMQDAYTFATFARDFKSQNIAKVFEAYENALNNNNAIDFDDMLMLAVKLLEQNPEVRKKYFDKFQHIMVDEYQDTNQAQYQLVNALYTNFQPDVPEERSLCVVGDVDQSIYSWRGADFRIIMGFQKDFPTAKIVKLEQNYRSTANILNAANAVIENNQERVDKVLYSQKGDGEKITYYEAQDEADEANFIVKSIKNTSDNYNQFSILYRTNAQSRALEEALIAAGIPYRIYGGLKFYDRKEIKDAIAYLKLIHNVDDSQSLRRIINVPKRAIGETTLKHLQEYADEKDMSLFSAILNVDDISTIKSGTATKLKDFSTLIMKFQEAQTKYQLPEFLSLVLERSGYLRELQATDTDEDRTRIENLQELVNVANEFEPEEQDNVLGEFLTQVSLVSDIDGMEEIANNVTLMTLHASKGLEFPIVFLAGCDQGIFPSARTMNVMSELEEERRLMYVGITRAETKLYLTTAKRRQMWGEYKYYSPSQFIEEIPQHLLETQESSGYSEHRSTFTSAVKSVKSKSSFDSDGYVKPVTSFGSSFGQTKSGSIANNSTGFGKNFVAPSTNKTTNVVKRTPAKAFVNKNPINKQKEEEKIKAFFENNIMKQRLEERKKEQARQAEEIAKAEELKNTATQYYFNVGERVFHEKLGIGHITDVIQIGESTMYTIDFGKLGKKAMDANYAHLKKF
ncbi:MAG: UvrD-helicase domain-containing protein [Candidatus Gastranaerophilales bacterium]|nr:UvrD-helicase domain-containing protein [Candidatus Gastranaerophilales bacterium]MCM1072615.1 UvrD-helicase domain-containing protein [Bacteroides sp.]